MCNNIPKIHNVYHLFSISKLFLSYMYSLFKNNKKLFLFTVLGMNDDECDGYVVSSESCAFPSVAGRLIREVQPGEIVEITRNGFRSICIMPRPDDCRVPAFCIFEYVYFARPDSMMEGTYFLFVFEALFHVN